MIVVAAILFGLAGLFIHVLIVVSIVLMALLLGLLASEARNQRGRGIVSEVVNEAKVVLEDIKKPGQQASDEGTDSSAASSEPTE
jgi:membrane protein implicated in regulation of membrane protease activity